jgi:hypothetical protein
MPPTGFSPEHLDYMQRCGKYRSIFPKSIDQLPRFSPLAGSLPRIRGVGRVELPRKSIGKERNPSATPSADVLVSLAGANAGVLFDVSGSGGRVSIQLGTWTPNLQSADVSKAPQNQALLEASLRSAYPGVQIENTNHKQFEKPAFCGIVIGVPTVKLRDDAEALPLDRLIKGMTGMNWTCRILAVPVPEQAIIDLRNSVIEEMRRAEAMAQAAGMPSPLSSYYSELLKNKLSSLTDALSVGAWQTGIYLCGEAAAYSRLAGMWQGIFAGENSVADPIHVIDAPAASELAAQLQMLAVPYDSVSPPGAYKHPFAYQTMLTSTELATYVHLPKVETGGFRITSISRFDVEPPATRTDKVVRLGKIMPGEQVFDSDDSIADSFRDIDLDVLNTHVFITGTTGSGKTRTIFHLLRQVAANKVPFLVLEPAKAEYRELLNDPKFGEQVQVFTVGNENVSPFRVNPFEVIERTPVGVHIDLIKSVISASFGFWTPLPQILEECLQEIYRDRGWDITRNQNHRTSGGNDPASYPTMTDLIAKVDQVIPRYGFDGEAKGRVVGSLRSRLNGLRLGSKGRTFDVQRSIPMDVLMGKPTILELESLGDDDDKAFFMGLLFIRLVEYRRLLYEKSHAPVKGQAAPPSSRAKLEHLLIFEEAHRLLTNTLSRGEEGQANPRAKAVESFSNLISEVRAYGQGIMVADQVPVKLAPDVIKNTNLKIALRIVNEEDRKVLAGSMAMSESQSSTLSTLLPFSAAVFAEGDDTPLLVRIPKPQIQIQRPEDSDVHARMKSRFSGSKEYAPLFSPHTGCTDTGPFAGEACDLARTIVERPEFFRDFNRLVLAMLDDHQAASNFWPRLQMQIGAAVLTNLEKAETAAFTQTLTDCIVGRASDAYISRRGAQDRWSYEKSAAVSELLRQALLTHDGKSNESAVAAFAKSFRDLHQRTVPPYFACERICKEPFCIYRRSVTELVERGEFTDQWSKSDPFNPHQPESQLELTWSVCRRAAKAIVSNTNVDAVRRVGLCFGQMLTEQYSGPFAMSIEQKRGVLNALCADAESDAELLAPKQN